MRVAIIGGTGVDEMDCFAAGHRRVVTTRFGAVELVETALGDREVIFVPRHGPDHSVAPSRINYRAQIAGQRKLEVDAVVGVCAVGSLRVDLAAGSFAVLSDFIDMTKHRENTFFDSDDAPVIHTDFTEPYCPHVSTELARACERYGALFEPRAIYAGVEGPRYETPTEIRLYASWGADVIGMTNLPEVVLAREAGLCYGALAVITNLASGLSPTRLSHNEVRSAMASASETMRLVLADTIAAIPESRGCDCAANNGLAI